LQKIFGNQKLVLSYLEGFMRKEVGKILLKISRLSNGMSGK